MKIAILGDTHFGMRGDSIAFHNHYRDFYLHTFFPYLVIGLVVGLGLVGFIDDWLKVAKQRSLGLNAKQKLFGQALVAGAFGYAGLQFPDENGLTPIS